MSNNYALNIGAKLTTARRKQKLSLREPASLANDSPGLLSHIENRRANPSVLALYNVSGALAVPIMFFFPVPEENPPQPGHKNLIKTVKTASELHANDRDGSLLRNWFGVELFPAYRLISAQYRKPAD